MFQRKIKKLKDLNMKIKSLWKMTNDLKRKTNNHIKLCI